jgi:uncharacterized protein (DUF2236 family)
MLIQALTSPFDLLRRGLVGHVRSILNDQARGERPVRPSDNALFPPGSVVRRVHADVTTMMVGGLTALLLQMLHPAALAGVLGHSNFREDMVGRLRRTARFIAVTTYADREAAEAAIARVRNIHDQVNGVTAQGVAYAASDPRLLAWVHVAEAMSFLDAWIAYGDRRMSVADQDRYFAEFGVVARKLGADPVPGTRAEVEALIGQYRSELRGTGAAREVARLILSQRIRGPAAGAAQAVLGRAAVNLLPAWARGMLDLRASGASAPFIRGTTFGMATTLRWAFAQDRVRAARP